MDPKIKAARITLGGFFKERREEMGRTQEELADFLDIRVNTLQRIEEGRLDWQIDMHHRICAALELKPYYVATPGPNFERAESSDLLRIWLAERPSLATKTLADEAGIPWTALHDLKRGVNLPPKHWPALEPVLRKYGWE